METEALDVFERALERVQSAWHSGKSTNSGGIILSFRGSRGGVVSVRRSLYDEVGIVENGGRSVYVSRDDVPALCAALLRLYMAGAEEKEKGGD